MANVNWTNVSDFQGIIAAPNNVNEFFYTAMFYLLYVVAVIVLAATSGLEASLLTASFVGFVLSLFLLYLGLIPLWVTGSMIGVIIFIILYIYFTNRE